MATLHSASSGLLIAMPKIKGDFFEKAVVLMLEHGTDGAFGLVLNRRTIHDSSLITSQFNLPWTGTDRLLYRGGPVKPESLWILHPDEYLYQETIPISEGIAVSRSKEALKGLVEENVGDLKLFVGCAAWVPGQLEEELINGFWLLAPMQYRFAFDIFPDDLWHEAIKSLGFDPSQLSVPSSDSSN
jgi:putative transcriptional regulator